MTLALDFFYVGHTQIGIAPWLAWTILGVIVLILLSVALDG